MLCALLLAVSQLFLILCFFCDACWQIFQCLSVSLLVLVAVMASATHFIAVIVFSHQDCFHIVIFAVESIRDQLLDYDRVWGSHADRRRKLQSDN